MTPTITKIWIDDRRDLREGQFRDLLAIHVSFSNGMNFESRISPPYDRDSIVTALLGMAGMIGKNPSL